MRIILLLKTMINWKAVLSDKRTTTNRETLEQLDSQMKRTFIQLCSEDNTQSTQYARR